ncbi:hypothetical protein HK097_009306 [Rhizophlyctis rosea]|uniref:Uncharacterized protein n=1 Tax=Rhizophlyctis rosea TaxID=64517 RepID=A0AAD5S952_9FUNG|nr:hypothetical protein HK097_009306 [Rhizophlyctis rosea]
MLNLRKRKRDAGDDAEESPNLRRRTDDAQPNPFVRLYHWVRSQVGRYHAHLTPPVAPQRQQQIESLHDIQAPVAQVQGPLPQIQAPLPQIQQPLTQLQRAPSQPQQLPTQVRQTPPIPGQRILPISRQSFDRDFLAGQAITLTPSRGPAQRDWWVDASFRKVTVKDRHGYTRRVHGEGLGLIPDVNNRDLDIAMVTDADTSVEAEEQAPVEVLLNEQPTMNVRIHTDCQPAAHRLLFSNTLAAVNFRTLLESRSGGVEIVYSKGHRGYNRLADKVAKRASKEKLETVLAEEAANGFYRV